jgi:CheY-like chemotaxis protein
MKEITMIAAVMIIALLAIGGVAIMAFPLMAIILTPYFGLKAIKAMNLDSFDSGHEMNILIVDDDESSTWLLQKALSSVSDQIKISVVKGGKEAIEELADREFDLVFMDHEMPDLSGPDVVKLADSAVGRRYEDRKYKTPIITYTSKDWQDWDEENLRYMSIAAHMSKGLSFNSMKGAIREFVENSTHSESKFSESLEKAA